MCVSFAPGDKCDREAANCAFCTKVVGDGDGDGDATVVLSTTFTFAFAFAFVFTLVSSSMSIGSVIPLIAIDSTAGVIASLSFGKFKVKSTLDPSQKSHNLVTPQSLFNTFVRMYTIKGWGSSAISSPKGLVMTGGRLEEMEEMI